MKKEFIPYKEALALKELGFDEPCFATYHKELHAIIPIYAIYTNQDVIKAPLYQQAFRWFRYEHLLEGLILPQFQSILAPTPSYFIAVISYKDEKCEEKFNSSNNKDEKNFLHYGTYEEAELACLNKLIEIVKRYF